ncbi:MAG: hypothetical protein WCU88_07330 [Elusimicrobiota bacterium]|jgi:hypothetical protein
MNTRYLLAFLFVPALIGECAAAGAAPAAVSAVAASTDAVKPMTVADLYNGSRYRDPFRAPDSGAGPGAGAAVAAASPQEEGAGFSIHSLNLKGILKESVGASAVLVDPRNGIGYLLKNGRLFDYKNHRIPGVTGVVQIRQKSVMLMTPDKDVQMLRLGEEEDAAVQTVQ